MMSINFSDCFTSFTTQKYNKSNLVIYIIILFSVLIISKTLNNTLYDLIILGVISILAQGYYAIASHNEGHGKNNIIPNINDIGEIFSVGFKFLTGVSTLGIIVFLPCILCFSYLLSLIVSSVISGGTASKLPNITDAASALLFIFVFLIVGIILFFKYVIPATLLFLDTLNLSDMYVYSKINKYGYLIKKDYWYYLLYTMVLSIIIQVAVSALSPVILSLFGLQNINQPQINTYSASADQLLNTFSSYMSSLTFMILVSTVITSVFTLLLMPNLNGQVIKNTKNKPKSNY